MKKRKKRLALDLIASYVRMRNRTYFKRLEALDRIARYDLKRCPKDPHLDHVVHMARKALGRSGR
jgi:hypothetical protein